MLDPNEGLHSVDIAYEDYFKVNGQIWQKKFAKIDMLYSINSLTLKTDN